jgi:hypothetical protein
MGISRIDFDVKADALKVQGDQPNRQATVVPINLKYGGFTKVVVPGDKRYYQTLAAALADAVSGDSILVTGTHTITSGLTISVSNIDVTFAPDASISVSGGAYVALTVSGTRVYLENVYLSLAGVTSAIVVSGNDVELFRCKLRNASGTTTNGFVVNAGALRTLIIGSISIVTGAITNKLVNGGTDTDASIRGA